MGVKVKQRYGHKAGLTWLLVDFTSNSFITCGNDTDVRVWRDIDDDDVIDLTVLEPASAIACHGNAFYLGSSASGVVKGYDKNNGTPKDGFITKFTLPVTHLILNGTGDKIFIASSEVGVIRWLTLSTLHFVTFGQEHDAPVLSLALDPKEEYLASASGDGTVRIWKLASVDCIAIFSGVLMKTNDIRIDRPLARLCWQPKGDFLAVPGRDSVHLYERNDGWKLGKTLQYAPIEEKPTWFSVCCYSRCGKYLASGSLDGKICIWNINSGELLLKKHVKTNVHICSIAWDPVRQSELLFCDVSGTVGALKDLDLHKPMLDTDAAPERKFAKIIMDDDEDNDQGMMVKNKREKRAAMVEDDDIGDDVDIGALKARYYSQIGLDENGETIGPAAQMDDQFIDDDDLDSVEKPLEPIVQPAQPIWKPVPPQPAFIVGSMPESFPDRCMKWNADGIVKQYNSGGDNTIEVRYHDASIYHQFIVDNNQTKFNLADLSRDAAAFASSGKKSQLRITYLKSWDDAPKDWNVDAPVGESIECLCLGNGWVAFATNARIVRVFTIAGVQRHIFTLPGPLVTMCGQSSRLAVVYHDGMGLDGDQNLAFAIYKVNLKHVNSTDMQTQTQLIGKLAISPKSTLIWLGFTPNGTLASSDSNGVVRLLNRGFQCTWLQICDTKQHMKSKSESAWIVSVQDSPPQIRCVVCKNGSVYPTLSPVPGLTVLQWQLPICDTGAERIGPESAVIINDYIKGCSDFTFGEQETLKSEIETVVKLFGISCKTERDCRSLEIAQLMPTSDGLQILIRQAVSQKRHILAKKMAELACLKSEQEEQAKRMSTKATRCDESLEMDDDLLLKIAEDIEKPNVIKLKKKTNTGKRDSHTIDKDDSGSKLDLASPKMDDQPLADSLPCGQWVNPFKKKSDDRSNIKLPPGAIIFDIQPPPAATVTKKRAAPAAADRFDIGLDKKWEKKSKQDEKEKQITLQSFATGGSEKSKYFGIKSDAKISESIDHDARPKSKKTALGLWMEDHEGELIITLPDDEESLEKYAMKLFKQIPDEEKKKYKEKAEMMNAMESDESIKHIFVNID